MAWVEKKRDWNQWTWEVKVTVTEGQQGQRIDLALVHFFPWRSRARNQRDLISHAITVNGKPVSKHYKLKAGDVILIEVKEGEGKKAAVSMQDLSVVFEDEWFIAVNKPAGLVMHPTGGYRRDTLINWLHLLREKERGEYWIIHRLDQFTSGVVLLGKTREARRIMGEAFETRQVKKEYLALVEGTMPAEQGRIEADLGQDQEGTVHVKRGVVEDGQPSVTGYEVREKWDGFALVLCRPLTGRLHQIRVHLASVGCPLAGDWLYNPNCRDYTQWLDPAAFQPFAETDPEKENGAGVEPGVGSLFSRPLMPRQALHAWRLYWDHPFTGKPVCCQAPLARDMEKAIGLLRERRINRAG